MLLVTMTAAAATTSVAADDSPFVGGFQSYSARSETMERIRDRSCVLRFRRLVLGAPLILPLLQCTAFTQNTKHLNYRRRPLSSALHAKPIEECDICIIGGGVSGLAAAQTCGKATNANIVLLEASETIGGRVQSDVTDDGYILDRGFAVFLEEYPTSKALLDYDALELHQFDPGALVKQSNRSELSRVADPLRQPKRLLDAALSPVGSAVDKVRLIPLLLHVVSKSVDELFEEEETDTLTCLKERYGFSDDFVSEFLAPFLEGIYLTPLYQQSSRMFHFVFKMFTIGSVSLPRDGIGAVSAQLAEKAKSLGVDIRTESPVNELRVEDDGTLVISYSKGSMLYAKQIILATDVKASKKLISTIGGYDNINGDVDEPVERAVGCLYYSFESNAPIEEPILILNGLGEGSRNTKEFPANNACFPSVVCKRYAPPGFSLCSVSILESVLDMYQGDDDGLDAAVRSQLATWFPSHADEILDPSKWVLKRIYRIANAQPAQYSCDYPANENIGRNVDEFRGVKLPHSIFLAGDHMTTSSLNGALASGVIAGNAAVNKQNQ